MLRRAAEITAEAHGRHPRRAAGERARARSHHRLHLPAPRGLGPRVPDIVGGGANATILHYIENRDAARTRPALLIDAGCEIDGYTADVPAHRRWRPVLSPQRRLYEAVLDTQIAAIEAVKPGATSDGFTRQSSSS